MLTDGDAAGDRPRWLVGGGKPAGDLLVARLLRTKLKSK